MLVFTSVIRSAHAVEAVMNHAVFRGEKSEAYIEVYWSVNPASLHYRKDSAGKLSARIRTQLRITGDTGVVYKELYYLQTKPFDPAEGDAQPILEQIQASVPIGSITVELQLSEDGHPASNAYYRDTLAVPSLTGPTYSTLQLLDTFFASYTSSVFLKAGYQQLPRALNFYDEGQQRLHIFTELYRTADLPELSFPLTQTVYISKNKGEQLLAGLSVKDTIAAASPIHRFRHSFSTASLPSGNYYVNASLRTSAGVELTSTATFFQTINKNPVTIQADSAGDTPTSIGQVKGTYLDLNKTFVAKFSMPQLRAILKMLQPTADEAEVSAINGFLARPDELYMRYFIYNHFLNIDKADPARAWKKFSDVVREVNRLYKAGSTMGYETDRGIIYLRFGEPAEVVRVPNEAGALPYEIWRYNVGGKIQGSGLFLFYSPSFMSSDFRLLHSTVPGERKYPDWHNVLYSTGQASGNANSRAEEYLGKQ